MEWNARVQVTTWNPVPPGATAIPGGPIDYASKHWSGLISGYYQSRAAMAMRMAGAAAQAGLSLELWLGPFGAGAASGQALVDVQGANGTGLRVGLVSLATPGGAGELTLQLALQDSRGTHATYLMDANCAWLLNEALESEGKAHVVLIVDASAHIAMAVVQGLLCNGAGQDVQGWQWLPLALGDLQQGAASSFVWGGSYGGALLGGRWYTRAITVTEAIGNSRAGPPSALGE
jgi:hypothetical protein